MKIIKQAIRHSVSTSLIVATLFSFNASATSPTHPGGVSQNMIASQTYNASNYQVHEASKMFPMPTEGMEQHVLTLPAIEDEENYMVEIQIGQTRMVDCNKHSLMGELKRETAKGWGYGYYSVKHISDGPSTMMACLDLAKKEAFLQIPGSLKINYDSRLPKVFYLPEGSEIRYRIWTVDSQFNISKLKTNQ
ncbi:serine protease inhibitor ecotin [Shewanella atlantica]|uniref:serine protease inhibitor ecotin n=1 Tax=Shewanella atlantica TaxID=271099 RepID=UPI00373679C1